MEFGWDTEKESTNEGYEIVDVRRLGLTTILQVGNHERARISPMRCAGGGAFVFAWRTSIARVNSPVYFSLPPLECVYPLSFIPYF